jgi:hypothetical protein
MPWLHNIVAEGDLQRSLRLSSSPICMSAMRSLICMRLGAISLRILDRTATDKG